ncbi:hypothetical protein DPSP01_012296 [Paraphaeosphaeria sporulosa]|uniref:Uncharacterized protein n=1 Tax=Paraphaeosphaeria sporulosa TaxID=1460663 RepID=A0A177CUP7_9PLEO|nr:uncharacterized protein CC84DRAFT_1161528 [Paraphaeosphaeria sporulosa]OAG10632.1 hypothetical protein CC84DRAFT_1161528 [Paraphaeosphaeria sporulosa]
MSLSVLPTELRQMIIEEVLTTPLSPPSVPSEVRGQNWFYPNEENKRRYSLDADGGSAEQNPAIAFNKQEPWGLQYLPLLLINKALNADTEDVLRRVGRHVPSTLDVMLEDDGNFKATWLLVPPAATETERLDITIRTLKCMKTFGAEGSENVPLKRNANMSVGRLLQRITSIGLSPYAKDRQTQGTQVRRLRITIVTPADGKIGETEDERAPLAARLSEYFSMGYFEDLAQRVNGIEIFVDDRKAYAFSSAKSSFVMEWSHKWRRDSAMED